ncbi:tail fiber assembly protein [Salmonella enterica subsp. enterica serovar Johannesburg]|uniref:Phage tail protein n=1 Tax=Salmonella enterica TaxID=28901 RepID=A0A5U5U8S1_SALER|nr:MULTISPECIES: tail fiber assembly protein [Enterobacteriaceae]EAA7332288.1 phage tail protein [Salmonella enterica subsp. enterica]EHC59654.1 Tail fiber assembly protein [Salmonella enterica subsp. enterica serovar Johannesburg str. S5-703]EAA9540544.1 phage tail protein [Salmonella enterica subsp. enterica]EAM7397647.1 phage tail protein [Salmonella enterica subsp. enterica serovar Johannesburg]EAM7969635.1 tail fiber assembly protein [Salmonella enterica subsp. enterica serovar Johannesbu
MKINKVNYIWDATNVRLLAYLLKDEYNAAGMWPENGIDVSDEISAEFTGQPPEGKIIGVGADGMPAWVDMPPPSREELISAAEQVRQQLLANADAVMLDWRTELMLGEISDANRAKLSAWIAYKYEVKAVDVTIAPENINWPITPKV